MLNITTKTTRADFVSEIYDLRDRAAKATDIHAAAIAKLQTEYKAVIDGLGERVRKLEDEQADDIAAREHAERKCELLAEDVSNLLGTIRVLSDPARPIRIRMSTVTPSDIATALPRHNTERR